MRTWIGVLLAAFLVTLASPAAASPRRGTLVALDAADGSRSWAVSAPKAGGGFAVVAATKSTVVAVLNRCFWDDNAEYTPGDSTLIGWDARSGREQWRTHDIGNGSTLTEPPGGTVVGAPASMQPRGVILVSSTSKEELRGLSTETGTELWRIQTHGLETSAVDSTHILLAPPLFASQSERSMPPAEVALLDARTGKRQWTVPLAPATKATGAAVLSEGIALLLTTTPATFTAPPERLVLADRSTGRIRWERPLDSYALPASDSISPSSHLTHAGDVLILSRGATTIRVDPVSGNELWRHTNTMAPTGAATAAGQTILFALPPIPSTSAPGPATGLAESGVTAIDAASGQALWNAPIGQRVVTPGGNVAAEIPRNLEHDVPPGHIVDPRTGTLRWTTDLGDDDSLLATSRTLYRGTGCRPTLRD